MILVSVIPSISLILGKCISYLILFLNQLVSTISKAEQFIWSGIQINLVQVILLYIVISGLILFHKKRKPQVLIVSLCLFSCFLLSHLLNRWKHLHQHKFIVYCSHNQSVLGFISGNRYKNIIGVGTTDSIKLNRYVLNPSKIYFMLNESYANLVGQYVFQSSALFLFGNKIIVRINNDNIKTAGCIPSDFLILSNGNFKDILKTVRPFGHPIIIFDSSLPEWKAVKYKEILAKRGIISYIVSQNGAFISDFSIFIRNVSINSVLDLVTIKIGYICTPKK